MTYSLASIKTFLHPMPSLIQTKNITEPLEDKSIGCGVVMDLQNTCYTLKHQLLLTKLNDFRTCDVSYDWFKSYLPYCNQCVSTNGYESCLAPIECTLPQGSLLRLFLFLLNINDLNLPINFCKGHLFSGDLLCQS